MLRFERDVRFFGTGINPYVFKNTLNISLNKKDPFIAIMPNKCKKAVRLDIFGRI